jgi:transcriptional regulator with XRE-family HTH domain
MYGAVAGNARPSPEQGAGGVAGNSPTVRQRELGRRLRDLRNQHGLTVEAVADKLLFSATKLSRLETAVRRPSLRDVRDLCALYEVGESTSQELMNLARGAREQGWWTKYEDVKLDPYLGMEQDATAITSYTTYYFPGLLQTEAYTRSVIKAIAPKMDPGIFEQRVAVRMRRQEIFEGKEPPSYHVLLDEAVLRRHVGGTAIMSAQLEKVLTATREGRAAVRVIPFDVGVNAAQDSNFVLLEFKGKENILPMVFVEGLTANQYLERESDVARYREAIVQLGDSALSSLDSVKFIDKIRKDIGAPGR